MSPPPRGLPCATPRRTRPPRWRTRSSAARRLVGGRHWRLELGLGAPRAQLRHALALELCGHSRRLLQLSRGRPAAGANRKAVHLNLEARLLPALMASRRPCSTLVCACSWRRGKGGLCLGASLAHLRCAWVMSARGRFTDAALRYVSGMGGMGRGVLAWPTRNARSICGCW